MIFLSDKSILCKVFLTLALRRLLPFESEKSTLMVHRNHIVFLILMNVFQWASLIYCYETGIGSDSEDETSMTDFKTKRKCKTIKSHVH